MRAYLQLVRLPNVFTAMADILLGYLLTHEYVRFWPVLALLLGASSLLYMAGMVLNDYFDREQDARELLCIRDSGVWLTFDAHPSPIE